VFEQKFAELLTTIHFTPEVLDWVADALQDGHSDERKAHEDAIARLQREHRRIQDRIDAMYLDKLDGRIDNDFFDRKAAEFRGEQARIMGEIEAHQGANKTYLEEGARLFALAHRAHIMFLDRPPAKKRKPLDCVVSECKWKGGELEPVYREPFGILAAAGARQEEVRKPVRKDVARDAHRAGDESPADAA
jgi:hypothetical protein